jgi:hypothetical protein
MRLPRLLKRRRQQEFEGEDFPEEEEFWDIREELQAANMDIEEIEEEEPTAYSGILLSEPDEACRGKIRGKEYVLPEYHMIHMEKKAVEQETFGGGEENLKEKGWEKEAPETLEEIRNQIDAGLLEEKIKEAEEFEDIYEEAVPIPANEPADWMHTHPVPGTIINREIIYDTDGGFVVKVIYKEGDQIKTSYYSVSKVEGIEQALDDLASFEPIIEDRSMPTTFYEPPKTTPKSTKREDGGKKSLMETLFGKK